VSTVQSSAEGRLFITAIRCLCQNEPGPVDIDFPLHKEQTEELKRANQALAEKFGVEGYPTVVVLSSEGSELKKETGYSGQSAKEFISQLERLRMKDKS